MYRKVLTWPNSKLKKIAIALDKDDSVEVIADLKDSFAVTGGLGLAAPQIGIEKRALIINPSLLDISTEEKLMVINPTVDVSGEVYLSNEACFSIPHISSLVPRYSHCKITFYNENWEKCELDLEGLSAACIQHEVDHLDGKLFLDRLSRLKRQILTKKLKKAHKEIKRIEKDAAADFARDHAELHMSYNGKKAVTKTTYSKKRKLKKRRKSR
jgi:peptide deformylase